MKPLVPLTILLLVLLLVLLLGGCNFIDSLTGSDNLGASLSGRVTSTSRGPVYPASVALLQGRDDLTYDSVDVEGHYRIRSVSPGTYTLILTLGERGGAREFSRETFVVQPGNNAKDFVVP
jgi:hypothetical protein